MPTLAHDEPARVTGGVDTHKDVHVAAVLDEFGRLLATESFPTTRCGYPASCAGCAPTARSLPWASRAVARGAPGWPAISPPEA